MKRSVTILIFLTLFVFAFILLFNKNQRSKPEIIDFFACSDYCPGPKEKYIIKIYKGINTKKECEKLKGEFYEFYGWKKYQVCKIK